VPWWSGIRWPAGTVPILTSTPNKAGGCSFVRRGCCSVFWLHVWSKPLNRLHPANSRRWQRSQSVQLAADLPHGRLGCRRYGLLDRLAGRRHRPSVQRFAICPGVAVARTGKSSDPTATRTMRAGGGKAHSGSTLADVWAGRASCRRLRAAGCRRATRGVRARSVLKSGRFCGIIYRAECSPSASWHPRTARRPVPFASWSYARRSPHQTPQPSRRCALAAGAGRARCAVSAWA
jgi:hypothetical protein